MSLRRSVVLLQRGIRGLAASSLETCAPSRFCVGPSTSGRQWSGCLPPGTRAEFAGWGFASTAAGVRSMHGKPEGPRQYTAAEIGSYLGAAAVIMVGLSWAMVPVYRLFCAATGYGGTVMSGTTVEEKLRRRLESPDFKVEEAAAAREIRVWFNADVADTMPWTFVPTQEYVRVKPGQSALVFFTAHNKSDQPVTGYSIYNVTPDKAAFYFNKIQCFCFEEQRLRGGETIDMPVFFYIDPEFATDWNCRNVNDITLSYMFYKVENEDEDEEDDGLPTVVKVHSGPHPPAALPPGVPAGMVPMKQQQQAPSAAGPAAAPAS